MLDAILSLRSRVQLWSLVLFATLLILAGMATFVVGGPVTGQTTPTITSPPSGSALNYTTGIQASPVSCGFSDPNSPFTFSPGLVGAIQPSTSMSLPSGSSDYIYVGSDAGGSPLTDISWNPDLSLVSAYSGNQSISIGQSATDSGSFDSGGTTNVAVAGLGVTGYTVASEYKASSGSDGTSLSVPFSTSSGDLVVVALGGEGVGLIQQGGASLDTLLNDTYSECGSNVIASAAMFGGFLSSGSYSASFSATTYLSAATRKGPPDW
jgi:hypothetical protein